MQNRLRKAIFASAEAALMAALWVGAVPTIGQAQTYKAPRTADGKPDLNGIWEALNTANWDIQDHAARMGPVVALGAAFSVPAGLGVVEGNEIPYLPEAAAKKKENAEHWLTSDPEIKCYLPGVPRATYMPYPFQIFQTPQYILIAYEFAGANRTIYMNGKQKSPNDTWMGWSVGHWEGDTLVVDVTRFNDQTWFDRAGWGGRGAGRRRHEGRGRRLRPRGTQEGRQPQRKIGLRHAQRMDSRTCRECGTTARSRRSNGRKIWGRRRFSPRRKPRSMKRRKISDRIAI